MSWLKDAVVDILVTVVIIIAVLVESPVINGIVIGYTGLLLVVKAVILIGDDPLNLLHKTRTKVPYWLSHLLYGINTVVLLYFGWWYTGAAWVVIWILSYLADRKINRSRRRKSPAV